MTGLIKDISKVSAVAGVWTLTLSDLDNILVGAKVTVGGLPTPSWNVQDETVDSLNTTLKTITYSHGNATVAETTVDGVLHVDVSWIDTAYLETLLGYEPAGDDATYLAECIEAAEDWAFRVRYNSGYRDHANIQPSQDVRLGTALYALALYREKGSVDGFASFDGMNIPASPTLSMGRILQLLGSKRPQVG
jgi:hypothetical protein